MLEERNITTLDFPVLVRIHITYIDPTNKEKDNQSILLLYRPGVATYLVIDTINNKEEFVIYLPNKTLITLQLGLSPKILKN